jgi:3-oxoacyl-[acyl-carrier-protein] synthase III
MKIHAQVYGTGMQVPEHIITNEWLSTIVDTSEDWIMSRTGMKERRQVKPKETASDLIVPAAQQALDAAGMTARELDMIIVATISSDMIFPAAACVVQDRIGAGQIPAFDVSAGCTGAIYALAMAEQFIRSGTCKHILVVGAELLTKITNWNDRSTCVLFGDGAGAMVLGPSRKENHGFLGSHLASDGRGAKLLCLPAGGSAMPPSHETVEKNLHTLQMRGNEIYKTAINMMSQSCRILLEREQLDSEDIDLFVFHQANLRIIEAVGKRLNIPTEKVFVNIQKYGNTSSASTMMAIHEAIEEKKIKEGSLVLQVAFGAGLTWGGVLWRW